MGFRNTTENISYTQATDLVETLCRRASELGFHCVSRHKSRSILWQMSAALKVMEKGASLLHHKDVSWNVRTYIEPLKCDEREKMKK